jgi:hypothetical protein
LSAFPDIESNALPVNPGSGIAAFATALTKRVHQLSCTVLTGMRDYSLRAGHATCFRQSFGRQNAARNLLML